MDIVIESVFLRKRGIIDIIGYDPKANKTAEMEMGNKIKYAEFVEEALKDSECALLITEWEDFAELTPDYFKIIFYIILLFLFFFVNGL